MYEFFETVNSPGDLKSLYSGRLEVLAESIGPLLIQSQNRRASVFLFRLCQVLAIAIHYVFDTPEDKLIWDVGHQAYAHKILSGRRELDGSSPPIPRFIRVPDYRVNSMHSEQVTL